jgi:hypothetical protein
MKASKQRTYTKALLIIILTVALFYFHPDNARAHIPSVTNQNCALILNAAPHQNLSIHPDTDLYIAKDSESADDNKDDDVKENEGKDNKDDNNNKDEEDEDDDWEAC